MRTIWIVDLLGVAAVALACADAGRPEPPPDAEPAAAQRCEDPRPQMCAHVYQPVCALRDTGIRCVTTPCDSSERRTYPNGCAACQDPAVSEFVPGAC